MSTLEPHNVFVINNLKITNSTNGVYLGHQIKRLERNVSVYRTILSFYILSICMHQILIFSVNWDQL